MTDFDVENYQIEKKKKNRRILTACSQHKMSAI